MPIIRKFAVQGHSIPKSVGAQGPFPPELYFQPRAENELEHSDSLHVGLDDVRFFKCKECGEVLLEDDLDDHVCED